VATMRNGTHKGFTLIELVVTMSISTVVIAFVAMFISAPVKGFTDQARRAGLVDAADSALRRIGRDVRRALPNSIRITAAGSTVALELLSTVDGARYRAVPPGGVETVLDFSAADGAFNLIGPMTQVSKPFSSTSHYLSVYNVGVPGADAYELANVITPAGTRIDIVADAQPGEDRVTLAPAYRFAYESPTQRMFLVDGPVTYLCDAAAGTLTRYAGYSIASSQGARDSAGELLGAGASSSLMADRITACAMSYTPGTSERAGLVTLNLGVGADGESIALLSQIHVDNAP
jgi:MSHA biogenesis protein MshO